MKNNEESTKYSKYFKRNETKSKKNFNNSKKS